MAADTLLTVDDIKAWLKANDRSTSWLARQAGVDVSHLWRILRGERVLMGETQRKISETIARWNRSSA